MSLDPRFLLRQADPIEYEAGSKIYEKGGVRPLSSGTSEMRFAVADMPRREVILCVDAPAQCSCDVHQKQGACRHVVAATLLANDTGSLREMERKRASEGAPLLLAAMEGALPETGGLRMELTLLAENRARGTSPLLRAGIRIGEDRLYVVRSIPQFIDAIDSGEPLPFGKGFTFQPRWMQFTSKENRIIHILRGLCQAQADVGAAQKGVDARTMRIPPAFALDLFAALSATHFRLAVSGIAYHVKGITHREIPIHYSISNAQRGITISATLPEGLLLLTPDAAYVWHEGEVVAPPRIQRSVLTLLAARQWNGEASFDYSAEEAPRVIGEVLPWLQLTGSTSLSSDLSAQILRLPLTPKLYLDKEGRDVIARTVFAYGDHEIDPFAAGDDSGKETTRFIMRDAAREHEILDELANAGFHVRRGKVYLSGEEDIYHFVTQGVERLSKCCEIYASNDFKRIKPRRPALAGAMALRGDRLVLTFTADGEPSLEILSIMEALSQRKKYFRLKDGSFLDLGGMEEWEELADTLWESAKHEPKKALGENGEISMAAYRTMYIDSLLAGRSLPVSVDATIKSTAEALLAPKEGQCPASLKAILRPYQLRGFSWLKSLHELGMGGVLADDMGLGKTLQVIALLLWAKEQKELPHQPSIVVAPTSLGYNWQAEIAKYAPSLSVLVLSGSQATRAAQIAAIVGKKPPDVVITSYPLIRRDITLLREIPFRFAILDEAQHIKNAMSVGASAVRQLCATTKFALTGTPMENNVGELWSIFDFVLPGYLMDYQQFIRRYGDGNASESLRRKIRPFLMRRLKKDVLEELPAKSETSLVAKMPIEQQRVYQAALLRLRDRVDTLLRNKGMQRGRVEVLAAITELRQICCHPALCMPDYSGTSGKLELLLEIVPAALTAGRRILLFSQFTSMLKILRRNLEAEGVHCLYLDGETPAPDRLAMADSFNRGEGHVFLISLKAGGTGLNLTGADMVIHYDPWWNPAAEDQATDRAYRIGQKKNVDVMKLITHDSIEEQILKLGKKKRALFDKLITPGEEMPQQLSEEDIRALFA